MDEYQMRTGRLAEILADYGEDIEEQNLISLLADVLVYCRENNYGFRWLVRQAEIHAELELEE